MEFLSLPFCFLLLYSSTSTASDKYWVEDYKTRCVGADVRYYVDQIFPRCCPCSPCERWTEPVIECVGNGDNYCVSRYRKCVFEEDFDKVFKPVAPPTTTQRRVPTSPNQNTTAIIPSTPESTDESIIPIPTTSTSVLVVAILVAVVFTSFFLAVLYKLRKTACIGNAVEKLHKIVPRWFQKNPDETRARDPSAEVLIGSQPRGANLCKVEEVVRESAQPDNEKPCDDISESKQESPSINKESIEDSPDKVPPPHTQHPEMQYGVNAQHGVTHHHVVHASPGSTVQIRSLRVMYCDGIQRQAIVDPPPVSYEERYAPSSFDSFNSRSTPPAYESMRGDVPRRQTHPDRAKDCETVTNRTPRYPGPRQHDENLHMRRPCYRDMFRQSSNISSTSTTGAVENEIPEDDPNARHQFAPLPARGIRQAGENLADCSSALRNLPLHARSSQQRRAPENMRGHQGYGQERYGICSNAGYEERIQHSQLRIHGSNRGIREQAPNNGPINHGNRTDYLVHQNTFPGRGESPNLYQSTDQDSCESTPHYSQEESQCSIPIYRPPGDGNYSDRC